MESNKKSFRRVKLEQMLSSFCESKSYCCFCAKLQKTRSIPKTFQENGKTAQEQAKVDAELDELQLEIYATHRQQAGSNMPAGVARAEELLQNMRGQVGTWVQVGTCTSPAFLGILPSLGKRWAGSKNWTQNKPMKLKEVRRPRQHPRRRPGSNSKDGSGRT